jgi:hypothetical protein
MNSWNFYPILATKEAFENRIFTRASDLKKLLQSIQTANLKDVRGQILLKDIKKPYPDYKPLFESSDGTGVYIEYNTLLELKDILTLIEFKEEKVERIILYTHGFFIK